MDNVKDFLYDIEINTENLKAYTDILQEQLMELDTNVKPMVLLKSIINEINEMDNKIQDIEHKLLKKEDK